MFSVNIVYELLCALLNLDRTYETLTLLYLYVKKMNQKLPETPEVLFLLFVLTLVIKSALSYILRTVTFSVHIGVLVTPSHCI